MAQAAIRRLAVEDVQDYRRIRLSALRTTPDAFGSTYEAEAAQPDAHHAGRLSISAVFGAYAGDQIIGIVGCKRYEGARETHKAFLWGFFVEPTHRRGGVAGALLTESLAAMQGVAEQILLTLVANNRPAIALYERFGFRPYGLEPRALMSDDGYVDEVLMVLFLADGPSLKPVSP